MLRNGAEAACPPGRLDRRRNGIHARLERMRPHSFALSQSNLSYFRLRFRNFNGGVRCLCRNNSRLIRILDAVLLSLTSV